MSSITTAINHIEVDADGRIVGDVVCAECGYNLRTLKMSAACPECGMKVVVSARGDRLTDAPTHWRHGLAGGARLLRLGVFLAFPLVYPGVLVSCLGFWFLTRAQPDREEPALDRGYRLAARWVGLLGGAAMVCLAFAGLIAVLSGRQRLFADWEYHGLPIFDLVFLIGHALWVLGLWSAWRYLRVLAQRVPDRELASAFRGLGTGWLGMVFALAAINGAAFGLVRLGLLPGGSSSTWVALFLSLLFMVILLSLWVATLRVVGRLVGTFQSLTPDPESQ